MDGYINRPSDTKPELCNLYLCKFNTRTSFCKCFVNSIPEHLTSEHDVALELHPMRRGMSCSAKPLLIAWPIPLQLANANGIGRALSVMAKPA